MKWNAEQYQKVKDLWPTHSAGAIVREIAKDCQEPITRNSVMGVAYRLHLTSNGNKTMGRAPDASLRIGNNRHGKPEKVARIRPPPPSRPKLTRHSDAPLNARPCLLIELDDKRCHWPLGPVNETATLFCGGEAAEGWPYCPHHIHIAHARDPQP